MAAESAILAEVVDAIVLLAIPWQSTKVVVPNMMSCGSCRDQMAVRPNRIDCKTLGIGKLQMNPLQTIGDCAIEFPETKSKTFSDCLGSRRDSDPPSGPLLDSLFHEFSRRAICGARDRSRLFMTDLVLVDRSPMAAVEARRFDPAKLLRGRLTTCSLVSH